MRISKKDDPKDDSVVYAFDKSGNMYIYKNKIGNKYGNLTVISFAGLQNYSGSRVTRSRSAWMCECVCGDKLIVPDYKLINTYSTKLMKRTRRTSCGKGSCSVKRNLYRFPDGENLIPEWFIKRIERSAKKRGYEFDLTKEYLSELVNIHKWRCAKTHRKLYCKESYHSKNKHNISLDRIDPNLGYIKGNVQFVVIPYNMGKQSLSQHDFNRLHVDSAFVLLYEINNKIARETKSGNPEFLTLDDLHVNHDLLL